MTLTPGNIYQIVVNETNGGDLWPDEYAVNNPSPVINPDIIGIGGSYGTASQYPSTTFNAANEMYDGAAMINGWPSVQMGLPNRSEVNQGIGPTSVFYGQGDGAATPLMYFMRTVATGTPSVWPVGGYINSNGGYSTNAWVDIVGNINMVPSYNVTDMMTIEPDVANGLILESSGSDQHELGVVSSGGQFNFSLNPNGSMGWGVGVNQVEANDVGLMRSATGTLEVFNGSTTAVSLGNLTDGNSTSTNVTVTTLSSGDCVQSGIGGLLQSTTAGCISGTGTNGYVARWLTSSTQGTGILLDNGSVAGVNATSSTIDFDISGVAGSTNNLFTAASSTGNTGLKVLANGSYYSLATASTTVSTITYTIDASLGNVQTFTLSTSTTFTINNLKAGLRGIINLQQDATGSRTVTWPSSFHWSAGTAPNTNDYCKQSRCYLLRMLFHLGLFC